MPDEIVVAVTAAVAGVLFVSGVAKLRSPDDVDSWSELGVPPALRRLWLVRLHPIAELMLGVVLVGVGGILGVIAASIAVAVFVVYLALVWRAKLRTPDAECACFGTRQPITGITIVRNSWLVLLAIVAAFGIGQAPLFGGVVVVAVQGPWLIVAFVVVVITIALTWSRGPETDKAMDASAGADAAARSDEELADYITRPTPAVPVQQGDGQMMHLQRLAQIKPILLLAVSETCGSCVSVIARVDEWRALLPEVSVRMLLKAKPEQSGLTQAEGDQTLHDPYNYVRDSLGGWRTPAAVLLGTDGNLAGGPVIGENAIAEFVQEIDVQLHGR